IESHAEDLRTVLQNDELVSEIKKDYRTARLNDRQRALCDFAEKLTLFPASTTPADLDQLRRMGFSDTDILDATQVISYFNYINPIADGLGVDLESWMKKK